MTRNNSPLAPESDSGAPPAGGYLSYGEDEDRFEVEFYQKSSLRRCLCIFLYFITGGLFFLLLHWMPKLWSKMNLRLVFIGSETLPTHFRKPTHYESFLKTKKDKLIQKVPQLLLYDQQENLGPKKSIRFHTQSSRSILIG